MLIFRVLPERAGASAFAAYVNTAQLATCFSISNVVKLIPDITPLTHLNTIIIILLIIINLPNISKIFVQRKPNEQWYHCSL
jgi:hypothetical protein